MTEPINTSAIPASVQQAGPQAQQLYATALQFEQLLVEQLTQQLQDTTDDSSDSGDGSSDGSSDGTTALYSQMLPGALAQGITDDGGLGLANQLYQSLAAAQGISTTPTAATDATASTPSGAPATPTGGETAL
jgi:Rod binding domain-containing protein